MRASKPYSFHRELPIVIKENRAKAWIPMAGRVAITEHPKLPYFGGKAAMLQLKSGEQLWPSFAPNQTFESTLDF